MPSYRLLKTDEKIVVDGKLSEITWTRVPIADSFFANYPYDTNYARTQTQVMMTFDDNYLYVAAICYDTSPGRYLVQSLRRDFNYYRNDAFAVYIDPTRDMTNGFNFSVSPYGVQQEGQIQAGGGMGVNSTWDNKWYVEVENYSDRWIVEMAIPFRTLRYKEEVLEWGINFSRNNLKINENSSWSPVPRNFNIAVLNFAGKLNWSQAPPRAGKNISLIPYGKTSVKHDTASGISSRLDAGGDLKVGLTSSLNMDVTINPDFSETDVDDQVINLERFSIFFPEKRTFFLENSDLFAFYGFSKIRPFFSRRIGLNSGEIIPILGGVRVSGKLDQKWRMGIMNMQTKAATINEGKDLILSQNYSVAALQRQIGAASNIGGIFVNRQAFDKGFLPNDFNRVVGLDYNFVSPDSRWRGKLFYHHSFSPAGVPGRKDNDYAHASWVQYTVKKWDVAWNHEYVGPSYNAEVGFVQRTGYWRLEPGINYYMYPKSKLINRHGPFVYLSDYASYDSLKQNDRILRAGWNVDFQNSAYLTVFANDNYIVLTNDFDASGTGERNKIYRKGDEFRFQNVRAVYSSNFRKNFYFDAYAQTGEYYSGYQHAFGGTFSYRVQPYVIFSLRYDRSIVRLPGELPSSDFTLIGPRIDVSFTRKLFLFAYFQYNEQINNLNSNIRLQYRFRPMSDIFLVYSGNYTSENFATKGQALILKVNWWLNL